MVGRSSTHGLAVQLSRRQERWLGELRGSAEVDARTARRARIIGLFGRDWRQCDVAEATVAGIATVGRVRRRLLKVGLENAVYGYAAPGNPRMLSVSCEAKIVALACSDPHAGRSRWTTKLLAAEAVRRGYVAQAGRETIRLVLKHHGFEFAQVLKELERRHARARTIHLVVDNFSTHSLEGIQDALGPAADNKLW